MVVLRAGDDTGAGAFITGNACGVRRQSTGCPAAAFANAVHTGFIGSAGVPAGTAVGSRRIQIDLAAIGHRFVAIGIAITAFCNDTLFHRTFAIGIGDMLVAVSRRAVDAAIATSIVVVVGNAIITNRTLAGIAGSLHATAAGTNLPAGCAIRAVGTAIVVGGVIHTGAAHGAGIGRALALAVDADLVGRRAVGAVGTAAGI